jgi:hypothetical protein
MFCKDRVPNPTGPDGFLEEYIYDDAQDNTVLPLKIASMLSDPTGLIKDFHEEFDTIPEAKSM